MLKQALAACNVDAETSPGCLQILAGNVPVPPAMNSFHTALNRIFEKGRDPEKQKAWYLRVSALSASIVFGKGVSASRVAGCN